MFNFARLARAPDPPPKSDGDGQVADGKPQGSNNDANEDEESAISTKDNELAIVTEDREPTTAPEDQEPNSVTEDQEPVKEDNVPQENSPVEDIIGDYIGEQSRPCIMKILNKHGDKKVHFADNVLKFSCSGKIKRRVLIITDFALYIVDPETYSLRRRIALAAVQKLCLSKLYDHFFAVIVPTEYDLLMASTRKTEIMITLLQETKSASEYEIEISQSNRFEYNASSEVVKEIQFEEVEGGIKARIMKK